MKNDKIVLNLQIQGLQDHIVGLHQDHNELLNACFLKDEQIEGLKAQNKELEDKMGGVKIDCLNELQMMFQYSQDVIKMMMDKDKHDFKKIQ
jgi:hypothetical protein